MPARGARGWGTCCTPPRGGLSQRSRVTLSRPPPVPVGFLFEGTDDLWEQYLRDGLFLQYFTPLGNVTGLPGISLPLHWSPYGLPIGVHILGPPAGEALLLRLAAQLEAASPWRDRHPDLAVADHA